MTILQRLKRWAYVKATPLRHKYTYWKLHRQEIKPLKLLKFPHYILNRRADEVKVFDTKLYKFVERMAYTAENPPYGKAAGLAAPQIGRSIRLFIAGSELFINPTLSKSGFERECKEGCFSLESNKFDYPVKRAQSVWVKFQDLEGKWREQKYNGFMAQVIQHEYEHLEGHCLTSNEFKITPLQRVLFIKQALQHKFKIIK